uniref:Odorant receptor n=1 Tax=Calliphora stygia TaxID=145453 RepID=A0A068F6J1_CALSG|nr:odorant receptor [Calliphora stygia]
MSANEAELPQPRIKRYFHVQRVCFAILGINPTSLERTVFNHYRVWLPMIVQLLHYIPMVFYAIENINDVVKVTTALAPIWQAINATLKIIYFVWNRKKIVALVRKLWFWNLEAKDEELVILTIENRKDILFCTSYSMVLNVTGVAALLAPLLIAGFYAWKGEIFWEYLEPPVKASYGIDKQSVFGYIIVFILNGYGAFFVVYGTISADSLFSWFMCNIVAQFHILKYRLRQAGGENNGDCSMKTISDCIAYHCRIIELASDFNDAFSVVVFIKFAISCVQICCLAFKLSRGEGELFDQVYHGLFLICLSMQLMLYCYGGQRIMDESESIANEIYDSFHWESLSVANRKMLIFAMMRSQMPCNVCGVFFVANLALYLWVYRTAASMITLLKTIEED